ncbi:MAG TPA: chemotaxis protein CheR [Fibrobacteres bacterium]|nr:chemotaxis protein CheR [Fibrobacterota bacterium]
MTHTLNPDLLTQLSDLVATKTALHFPPERWSDLEFKTGLAAKEFGFDRKEEFIQWLLSSPLTNGQIDILASFLTIHETYFWREPQVFTALIEQVLPALVRSRKNDNKCIRIWSAGCATGEEPYSIAIALHKTIPALKEWNITILATDINSRILRKAMAGLYGKWSFRNAPQWLIDGYFCCKKNEMLEILPEIRKMVTFAYLNLAEDNYPSSLNNTNAMDIIFCRNVLMYFAPERARHVGQGLNRSLVDGGWLMVGASELSQHLFPQFVPVQFPEAIAYRKETQDHPLQTTFTHEDVFFQKTPYLQPEEPFAGVEQTAPPLKSGKDKKTSIPVNKPRLRNEYASFPEEPTQATAPVIAGAEEETTDAMAISIRALADRGSLDEALTLCEEVLASDKLNPGLYFLKASILQELNRIEEACVSLKRTLYLDQKFVLAHFALGNIALSQEKAPAAKKHFDNVLALLKKLKPADILPESEGLTVGRFREIIQATMETGALA